MTRWSALLLAGSLLAAMPVAAQDRAIVDAAPPSAIAVTVYRDPNRGQGQAMNRDWPQGFAMISETRQVTLPPGESTIRFEGVAEGMVAVSAIVTGLPGGTIEKNRNADLLSPAALVDGTLGNRVTVTRTNPATGEEEATSAVVRTRADGGLVLQTSEGFEAVRCAGLPERLTFDRVPAGLSAQPVFSIDTLDDAGGAYTVTLTYLAWGFDWQANYVATFHEGGRGDEVTMRLMSWLTVLNDNNQSFADAELMAVAGTLNVVSDFQSLADPPQARPLQLTCYPIGSTAAGSPVPDYSWGYPPPPPPPPPAPAMYDDRIVVTGMAMRREAMESSSPISVVAVEEALGDLKLYRVPVPVTVAAQGLKQVAFLVRDEVEGRLLYEFACQPYGEGTDAQELAMLFETVNTRANGLGVALPSGPIAVFEPSSSGDLLVAEESLRDYASGQDVEIAVGMSSQVMAQCERLTTHQPQGAEAAWSQMRTRLTNANPAPVTIRLSLGWSGQWDYRGIEPDLRNGERVVEVTVPANGDRVVDWQVRPATAR